MVRIKATIEGGDELAEKLVRMGVDVDKVLEAAAQAGARVLAQGANRYAPQAIIATETQSIKKHRVEVDVGPPDDKWYWQFLETGAGPHEIPGPLTIEFEGEVHVVGGASHPGMSARPFMRPGFDTSQGGAVDAVGDKIRRVVE